MLHFKREPLQWLMSSLEWCICVLYCIQNRGRRTKKGFGIVNEMQTAASFNSKNISCANVEHWVSECITATHSKAIKTECLIHQRHSYNAVFPIPLLSAVCYLPFACRKRRPGSPHSSVRRSTCDARSTSRYRKKLTSQATYLTYH